MTNAEAIKTLHELWRETNDSWYEEVYGKAIKALESQEWIPCKERLPETEEQVLIYAWNVHYVLAKYKEIRTCDGVYKMAWVTEDAYSIPQEIKHEVICWKPLRNRIGRTYDKPGMDRSAVERVRCQPDKCKGYAPCADDDKAV